MHCQEETRASVSTGRIAILQRRFRVFHPQEKRILTRNIYLLLHSCSATFLIICIVVWDGIPKHEADDVYKLLIHKLNKFGLPTTRRCATNENRTCACQGEPI